MTDTAVSAPPPATTTHLRVAFIGKGGAGKSTIVGSVARLMARDRGRVLVLDSDPMPGLAHALGVEMTDTPIPDDAVEEHEDHPRYRLREGLSAADAVEAYALDCPDGVRLLQLGKLHGHASAIMRSQFAFRQIGRELPDDDWDVIGDLPGGTRQPFLGWSDFAHTLLAVIEPTAKSILTGRRLVRLADAGTRPRLVAVANKVQDPEDADRIAQGTGMPVVAEVPWDPAIQAADRRGKALLDQAPDSPAVQGIQTIVTYLRKDHS